MAYPRIVARVRRRGMGVAPLVAVGAVADGLLSIFGGHHNSYPNGNPANLSKMDQMAVAGDLAGLQTVARGGSYALPGDPNGILNWSQPAGDAGRASERAYAGMLAERVTALRANGVTPTAGNISTAPGGTPATGGTPLTQAGLGLGGLPNVAVLGLVAVAAYFLLIRPRR
jgi:hypothetical protein